MALVNDIVAGLAFAESDLSDPVFTWAQDGQDYPCVPSVAEYTRTLDTGGFTVDKVLTLSARLLDDAGDDVYPTTDLPAPQQLITFQSDQYRIVSTKRHPTGAYLRIVASGITRGI